MIFLKLTAIMKSFGVKFWRSKADHIRIGKGHCSLATDTTNFKSPKNNCEDPNKRSYIPCSFILSLLFAYPPVAVMKFRGFRSSIISTQTDRNKIHFLVVWKDAQRTRH